MKFLLTILFLGFCIFSNAQITAWDDTQTKNWPRGFEKIDILSSADGSMQPSIIHKSRKANQPLIVSLHSWSGDYAQADSMSWEIAERDWNYIHPHFRGPNWTPQACGSELVIKDIDDAIAYAVNELNADPAEVHIVGSSGGGHAAMLCYLQLKYPVKSISAWVGISNLVDWYYESLGRGQKYAKDILLATGDTLQLNVEEAKKRSPLFVARSKEIFSRQLYLYAGVHDGYQGSVPITQTLQFYNRVVNELYDGNKEALIPEKDMLELVVKRSFPSYGFHMHTGDRKVHYYKSYGSVSVNIFEGKHEQIVKSVLALLPVKLKRPDKHKNILCIGDSNGEIAEGWVNQLRFELPYSTIINKCKSGNTIGFDNHGDTSLNELKTIHTHLKSAVQQINNQQFDYIIISLGTNDAKEQFAKSQKQIVRNLELLIQKIKNSDWAQVNNAKIIILSPPPIADDKNQPPRILEKFKGSRQRLEKLVSKFDAAAKKNNCVFVNSYQQLSDKWAEYSYDGIHYKANGARMAARALGLIAQ